MQPKTVATQRTTDVKPRSDNSERHDYTKPAFWVLPSSWFWENGYYTEASKEMYREFVRGQQKIADRQCKGEL